MYFAVSYTHLDVYKRQILCNTKIKKTSAILKNMRSENAVLSCIEKCHQISSEVNIDDNDRKLLKTLTYEVLDLSLIHI